MKRTKLRKRLREAGMSLLDQLLYYGVLESTPVVRKTTLAATPLSVQKQSCVYSQATGRAYTVLDSLRVGAQARIYLYMVLVWSL